MPVHSAKNALWPELIDSQKEEEKGGKHGKGKNISGQLHRKYVPNSDSVSNCTSNCISSDTVNLLADSQT